MKNYINMKESNFWAKDVFDDEYMDFFFIF